MGTNKERGHSARMLATILLILPLSSARVVDFHPTFLPEYGLSRFMPGNGDAAGQTQPDSHDVSIRAILAQDNEESALKNLIHVPWQFNDQSPMHHKRPDLDETTLDNLAYFVKKKRSSTESQEDTKQGARASCRVSGGPLCYFSRYGGSWTGQAVAQSPLLIPLSWNQTLLLICHPILMPSS